MLKITAILCLMMTAGTQVMAQVDPVIAAAVAGLRNPAPLPLTPSANAVTLHKENENDGSGNFRYSYSTSDGIQAEQTGILKEADPLNPEGSQAVQGSYSYVSPEGVPVNVRYIADENGYRVLNDNDPITPINFFNRNIATHHRRVLHPFAVDPTLLRHPNLALAGALRPAHSDLLTRELLLRQQQQQPFNRFGQLPNPYNFHHPYHQNRLFPGLNYYNNGLGSFAGGLAGRFLH